MKLVQPLWDFGKISAGVSAAEAGVTVTTGREEGARADVDLNVRKAYWGLKLARELRLMLEEGEGYLDSAQKKIEKQLADGSGNATVTDRLRLRTVRTEIEVRLLEAKRLEEVARSGLRALLNLDSGEDLDVDDEDFEPLEVPTARSPTTRSRRGCRGPRCGPSSTPSRPSARWPASSTASSTRIWC